MSPEASTELRRRINEYPLPTGDACDIRASPRRTLESYGVEAASRRGVAYADATIVAGVTDDTDIWTESPMATDGADKLFAGLGYDRVSARGGDDLIMGGPGADTLTGGGGRDRFLYIWPDEGIDIIADFAVGDEGDILDVGFFLARAAGADYHGDPFADGYIRVLQSGSDTLLQLDSDGRGDDFVTVATLHNVTADALVGTNWRLSLAP